MKKRCKNEKKMRKNEKKKWKEQFLSAFNAHHKQITHLQSDEVAKK